MAGATAFLAVNLCTGAPLFALWVGSEVVGERQITMTAVFLVVVVMALLMGAMIFGIVSIGAAYNRMAGHRLGENRPTWLRSANVKRETVSGGIPASRLEQIVMAVTCSSVVLFVIWFFVFAGSPIPNVDG
jgi:hypothetical protein